MQPNFAFNIAQSFWCFILVAIIAYAVLPHVIRGVDAVFDGEVPNSLLAWAHAEQLEARNVVKYLYTSFNLLPAMNAFMYVGLFLVFGILGSLTVYLQLTPLGYVTLVIFLTSYGLNAYLCKYNNKAAIIRMLTVQDLRRHGNAGFPYE